jgi:hypothetical protein
MLKRRVGQVGQLDIQGRSHDAAECGTYRLLERVGPNRWRVEYVAPCDDGAFKVSTLQFVSRAQYDRYF